MSRQCLIELINMRSQDRRQRSRALAQVIHHTIDPSLLCNNSQNNLITSRFSGSRILLSPLEGGYYFNDEYSMNDGYMEPNERKDSLYASNHRGYNYSVTSPPDIDNKYQDDSDNGTCCSDGSREMGQMPEIVKSYSLEL